MVPCLGPIEDVPIRDNSRTRTFIFNNAVTGLLRASYGFRETSGAHIFIRPLFFCFRKKKERKDEKNFLESNICACFIKEKEKISIYILLPSC